MGLPKTFSHIATIQHLGKQEMIPISTQHIPTIIQTLVIPV